MPQQTVPEPLMAACAAGDVSSLGSLLAAQQFSQQGRDATIFQLLEEAVEKKHKAIVGYLLEQATNFDFPRSLVRHAVFAGLDTYKLFLAKNPSILKHEWRGMGDAVCIALIQNNVELLTYLLDNCGADPGRSVESTRYAYIFLPLEFAAYSSTESNVRLLLKYGAIVRRTAALQLAAGYGRLNIVRVLVEAGAEVDGMWKPGDTASWFTSNRKETALHSAAKSGSKGVVQYLLDNGADFRKICANGYTVRERAKANGHDEIVWLINSYEL